MLAFRDFKPKAPGFFPSAGRMAGNVQAVLAEANDWIASEAIDVLGVETIGHSESAIDVRTIRIWYRTASPKTQSYPED